MTPIRSIRCATLLILAGISFPTGNFQFVYGQPSIRHFVFVERERERIKDAAILETAQISGAQIKYTWRELEPKKGEYHFEEIQEDLAFLKSRGKELFIQLQDVSFDSSRILVPQYLIDEPEYKGGANPQYTIMDSAESDYRIDGWVARRWDEHVAGRFHALLTQLGREFDGKIEGINLPETSVEFGRTGRLYPSGFTTAIYRDAILANMKALKAAFPRSVAIQYANFMPGEFPHHSDRRLLRDVYDYAKQIGAGVGGPDLLVYEKAHMNNSYGLIRECSGLIPTGIAVQWGNYEHINPRTGKKSTIPEMYDFARTTLKVCYMFWCTQEPYFSRDLMPFLKSGAGNSTIRREP